MKKILLFSIILIIIFIYFVPKYNELNNITIIDSIGVKKENNYYKVYFREVIPTKVENGLKYTYKIHSIKTNKLKDSISLIEKKHNKKLYLNKVKSLITNYSSEYIKIKLNINPKYIHHTDNVYSVIQE